jgi:hypothetical protein
MPVPVELLRFFDRAARPSAPAEPPTQAQPPADEARDNHRLPAAPSVPALTAPDGAVEADPELVAP